MKRTETTDAIFGWFIILCICGVITAAIYGISTWLSWSDGLQIWCAVVISFAVATKLCMWVHSK